MDHLTRPEGSAPEDLHVSRRAVTSMFFAGYAVAAMSAQAAPVTTPATGLTIEEVRIPNGDAAGLPAYVARSAGEGRYPCVVVANEVFGVHDYIKDVCRRLARAGYVAVAPGFFYRSGVDLPAIKDFKQIMPIVAQASEAQVDGDVRATIAWLRARGFAKPDAIGITGFCWGGTVVWRAAMMAEVRAGVAWYGRLGTVIPRAGDLKAPVLGLYAEEDQGIPLTDVAAMRAALKTAGKADSPIIVYPGVHHGFHADYRDSHDAAAAADGWKRLLAFFKANGVG